METTYAQASSSNGRAAVSKTACWGFESLLACHFSVADPAGHSEAAVERCGFKQ
jgi:hypothetical protein